MLSLIVIQTIADEQQHKYQTKKYNLIKSNKVLKVILKSLSILDYGNIQDIPIIHVNN